MITLKSEREIELMDEVGSLHAEIHEALRDFIKPGVKASEIDQFVQKRIEDAGAIAEQIGFEGYEYATCVSVNDEIAHGFPVDKTLKNGDLAKVDFVIRKDGALSDSCWAYAVGEVDEEVQRLMDVTRESMYKGIEQAVPGNRIGDIGHAIQDYVEKAGFSVVREYVGHGLGPTMHEEPTVYNYGTPNTGKRLKAGMTITVEPMVNVGGWRSKQDENGWTALTKDGSLSCQYEHVIAITEDGPRILTKQKGE